MLFFQSPKYNHGKKSCGTKKKKTKCGNVVKLAAASSGAIRCMSGTHQSGDPGDDGPSEDVPDLGPDHCPHCFWNPCIAQYEADWLGRGHDPSDENSAIRHTIYTRFWKCIANNNGWELPQYIVKKRRLGGGEWAVFHQREIMPECVLSLVRGKYPNLPSRPYMGHLWY